MSKDNSQINRSLVGILALICLGSAAAIWINYPSDETWNMWRGGFTRVGLVMTALWIALPSRNREAAWANVSPRTFAGLLLAVIAIAARPRVAIPVLIVVSIAGFLLRPRGKKRPRARQDSNQQR